MYESRCMVSLKPANPNDSRIVTLMCCVRNHIRDVGYPHRDHDCVASGPAHAPLKKGCDEAALLAKMALTIIVDGNMKACYKICQHQYGERYIDEVTTLSLHAQCKSWRSRGSLYCHDHAPLHVGICFDEDDSISTRTRVHVKLGKDEGACQNTHTVYARHSAGFLGAFGPCGVCVGRGTLATAESENEVAYFLHTLSNQGVIFDAAGNDDCCPLVPMLRRLGLLNDREFFIPRFHQFSHKCTKYEAQVYKV